LVGRHARAPDGSPSTASRQAFRNEATLGPDRHDDGVLDVLRLDQAENLGAEILRPVRPAYPAARHFTEAQMHRLQPRRINKDLVERTRPRDSVEHAAGELDGNHLFGPTIAAELAKIAAYRRRDRADEIANDAIFIEAVDRL